MPSNDVIDLLLVEDDEIDAMAVERALSDSKLPLRLHHAIDGEDALRRLQELAAADARILMLLDLNLPLLPGLDLLGRIREDSTLCQTPVFVLTTSKDDRDRKAAYDSQVAGYLVKGECGQRMDKLHALLEAYCEVVWLPGGQT